jgi:AraC-like DNA-binding protein
LGTASVYGQGKVHEGMDIKQYEWSMAGLNYPQTPGGDSVYAEPYNEVWHYNVDSLCRYMATDPNSAYTRGLMHYLFWTISIYTSEKQIKEIFRQMKAGAKKYNYPALNNDANYLEIFLPLHARIYKNGTVTKDELDNILNKMQEYSNRFHNTKAKKLAFFCDAYRICRLTNYNEYTFRYIPAILKLLEEVPVKDNSDYYYLYYFIGSDYLRFGDKERGVYYLKKALHSQPMRFSDRSDLRARTSLAEYFVEINRLDSADYYYRSLYDSPQMVRFRPIYDATAAGGIAGNLVKRGKYADALPLLERWLPEAERARLHSTLFGMYSDAFKCYIYKKQYNQAKAMLDSLRILLRYAHKSDIVMEIVPENSLPTEDLYELQARYFSYTGQSEEAQNCLDSMRIEKKKRMEKQSPLVIAYAEHDFFEKEKEIFQKEITAYKQNNHYLSITLVLILILLLITLYFYKKRQKAYQELASKSKEWAKERTLETVATEEEFNLIREAHELLSDGLFRDCELTLYSLAEKLSVNRNILSRAVNRVTGKHFNLFINEYRIKEAIQRIENTPRDNKNLYIDGLYQELGFNSPASFFRIFKQITGLSPGAFFRQIDKQDN